MSDQPDPSHIMQTATGFWASKVLLTAVDLELFTALGKVSRYELDGGELRLLEDEALLARFEARPRPPE